MAVPGCVRRGRRNRPCRRREHGNRISHGGAGNLDRLPALAAVLVSSSGECDRHLGSRLRSHKSRDPVHPIAFSVPKTRSSWAWSQALPDRVAMRTASTSSQARCSQSAWASCASWCPTLFRLAGADQSSQPGEYVGHTHRGGSGCRALGLQVRFSKPAPAGEIDRHRDPCARMVRRFVARRRGRDSSRSRRVQLTALSARHALPATWTRRVIAEVGGLMAYDTVLTDAYRQIGV